MKFKIGHKYIYDDALVVEITDIIDGSLRGDILYYISSSGELSKFPSGYYLFITNRDKWKLRKINKEDMVLFL